MKSVCKDCTERYPAVDAVEVKHGQWVLPKVGCYGCRCSECNTTWDEETNFCPNCGADMRERKET